MPPNNEVYNSPIAVSNINRKTEFDEIVTGTRNIEFSLASYTGPTQFRDTIDETDGATVGVHSTGEIKLSTNTSATASATLQTNERGVYRAGAMLEAGIGIRIGPQTLTSHEVRWGYFDDHNGFGWKLNSTGLFTFVKRGGSIVRETPQDSFGVDKLDGQGNSGLNLDLLQGSIYQVQFLWYGYGPAEWSVLTRPRGSSYINYDPKTIVCDYYLVTEDPGYQGPSIYQPNQPITVEVDNNGATSNLDVFVGGRQVSVVGGDATIPERRIFDDVENYTLSVAQGVWEPILAIRKRSGFAGMPSNPVNIYTKGYRTQTDEDVSFRMNLGAEVTAGSWRVPNNWPATETAAEVTDVKNGLQATGGFPISPKHYSVLSNNAKALAGDEVSDDKIARIGPNQIVMLEARPDSNNTTTISAIVPWVEEF